MLPLRDINPTRTFPLVTVSLIVVNTLVFLYMLAVAGQSGAAGLETLVYRAAVIPYEYTHHVDIGVHSLQPLWFTLFTSMFMHYGGVHLFGNMLYLWIFGNNVEDIMGHFRFLLFYLLCGLIAAGTYILVNPDSRIPVLGASGAIAGVLGAYLVRFPYAKVDSCLFIFIVRVPAVVLLAFWFILQLANGSASLLSPEQTGGTAWWAHIGGFLAGMVLVLIFGRHGRDYDYYPR